MTPPGEPSIPELFARGVESWPTLPVAAAEFERHVGALAEQSAPPQLRHAADLYLACACALGLEGALATFESRYGALITTAIARIDEADSFVDEVAQTLRIRLFVDAPPRIAAYGGRAKLSTWLMTLAARSAMDQRAAPGSWTAATEPSSQVDPIDGAASPELDYLRTEYKAEFEEAVVVALAGLSARDRALLRLHLRENMSIDRLAVAYGVGRSTAARWLAAARSQLLEDTWREVRARLGATESEIHELGRMLQSQIHVSIVRLLGEEDGPEEG
jgi:RNA polymerase sigma-70 factor (ECF subfamily)